MAVKKMVIMVSEGPYQSLKPYSALSIAEAAVKKGIETTLVYYADGVQCVRKGVGQKAQRVANYEAQLKEILARGAQVEACRSPLSLYNITEDDLIEGVKVAENFVGYLVDDEVRCIWL